MGYDTQFKGSFKPNKPFTQEQTNFINKFSDTRRMKRDVSKLLLLEPNFKNGFNGSYGIDGEYYIGDDETSVIDYNTPPITQPGLWCQWIIEDGEIQWDCQEKFYNYVKWLQYIIDNFLSVLDIKINGVVEYNGEDFDDHGKIYVIDNIVILE